MKTTMLMEKRNILYLPKNFEEDAREFLGLSGNYESEVNIFDDRYCVASVTFAVTKDQYLEVRFYGYKTPQYRLSVESIASYSIMK